MSVRKVPLSHSCTIRMFVAASIPDVHFAQQDPKLEGEQRDVLASRKEVATAVEALAATIT